MIRTLLLISCVLLLVAVERSGAHARVLQGAADAAQTPRQGTWAARSGAGPTLNGTWTAVADPTTGAVTGTWTLLAAKGKTVVARGAWSAAKSAAGWSGAWRAAASGSKTEYAGTWSARVDLKPDAQFTDLFETAVKAAVSGNWRAGRQSGTWSIRASQ